MVALLMAILVQVAAATSPFVAKPEVDKVNIVQIGETIAFPLYDGKVAYAAPNLERLGSVTIAKHDLFHDLGYEQTTQKPACKPVGRSIDSR